MTEIIPADERGTGVSLYHLLDRVNDIYLNNHLVLSIGEGISLQDIMSFDKKDSFVTQPPTIANCKNQSQKGICSLCKRCKAFK